MPPPTLPVVAIHLVAASSWLAVYYLIVLRNWARSCVLYEVIDAPQTRDDDDDDNRLEVTRCSPLVPLMMNFGALLVMLFTALPIPCWTIVTCGLRRRKRSAIEDDDGDARTENAQDNDNTDDPLEYLDNPTYLLCLVACGLALASAPDGKLVRYAWSALLPFIPLISSTDRVVRLFTCYVATWCGYESHRHGDHAVLTSCALLIAFSNFRTDAVVSLGAALPYLASFSLVASVRFAKTSDVRDWNPYDFALAACFLACFLNCTCGVHSAESAFRGKYLGFFLSFFTKNEESSSSSRRALLQDSREEASGEDEEEEKSEIEINSSPRMAKTALKLRGFFSLYTFHWVYDPFIQTAARRGGGGGGLGPEEMPLNEDFEEQVEMESQKRLGFSNPYAGLRGIGLLDRAMRRNQPHVFWTSFIHGWIFLTCMQLDPLLLHELLSHRGGEEEDNANSSATTASRPMLSRPVLVLILSVSMLVRVACMEVCFFYSVKCMANARTSLALAVFRKAMRGGGDKTEATSASLMSSDADRVGSSGWAVFFLSQWTFSLLSLPVTVWILHSLVGTGPAVVGVSLVVGGGLANSRLARFAEPVWATLQRRRDARSEEANRFLSEANAIKLMGMERVWGARLERTREAEMRSLARARVIGAFSSLISGAAALAVPVAIFWWYTDVDHKTLRPAAAFSALSAVAQISWSVATLPDIFNFVASMRPCANRLGEFLDRDAEAKDLVVPSEVSHPADDPVLLLRCENLTVYPPNHTESSIGEQSNNTETAVASHVSLSVKLGEIVVVEGPVGSGKTSLLLALSGARRNFSTRETKSGLWFSQSRPRRAFVEQRPFVMNGTIRDNVVFLERGVVSEERVVEALRRAQLLEDVGALPGGLDAQVGEGGVQLSGGQRARLSLARALYSNAHTYIIDDLFASLDAVTGNRVWEEAVRWFAEERGMGVVMSTHHRVDLWGGRADRVISLRGGNSMPRVYEGRGAFVREMGNREDDARRVRGDDDVEEQEEQNGGGDDDDDDVADETVSVMKITATLGEFLNAMRDSLYRRRGRALDAAQVEQVAREVAGEGEDAARDPTRPSASGSTISWSDVSVYFSRFGVEGWGETARVASVVGVWSLTLLACLLEIASPMWLSHWTSSSSSSSSVSASLVYSLLGLSQAVSGALLSLALTYTSLGASRRLHAELLRKLLTAPSVLFDATPLGSLYNVFVVDLRACDEGVPDGVVYQAKRCVVAIFQVAVISVLAPMVLAGLPFLLYIYYFVLERVRSPARDARRYESSSRAPVYSFFLDALRGGDAIRSYARGDEFFEEFSRRAAEMARFRVATEAVQKWAQAVATQTGCLLYALVGFAGVVFAGSDPARLGLLLSFAGTLQRTGMDIMMGWTALETNFVAVERVAALSRARSEGEGETIATNDDERHNDVENKKGASLEFVNVSLRYRIYRPRRILDGVTFRLAPGERLAVCGRTGCGKSSLVNALLRAYEIGTGRIMLDGRDVSTLPRESLRGHGVVEVVLQSGRLPLTTIRENLASFLLPHSTKEEEADDGAKDAEMRAALQALGIGHKSLEEEVARLSAGERQLVSLARVLLRRPRLVVLDEATSALDEAGEDRVYQAVFALPSTVLCVVHRLRRLEGFHKVAFMRRGKLEAFGDPRELFLDRGMDAKEWFRRMMAV